MSTQGATNIYFLLILIHIPVSISCYSCSDVADNEDCHNVTSCNVGEVCFARSDGFQTGKVTHTLGCKNTQGPGSTNEPGRLSFCSQTCREDFCNLALCQFGSPATRGPRCLSCDLVADPAFCKNVTECGLSEACTISTVLLYGKAVFRMGCVDQKFCSRTIDPGVSAVGRSQLHPDDSCSKCCTGDHCNVFVCDHGQRDNGEVRTLQPFGHGDCQDSQPSVCSAFGALGHVQACKLDTVLSMCHKSCDLCGQMAWSQWQAWDSCSVSCGFSGIRTRHRECVHQYDFLRNVTCIGEMVQSAKCDGVPSCQVTTTAAKPVITTTTTTATTATTAPVTIKAMTTVITTTTTKPVTTTKATTTSKPVTTTKATTTAKPVTTKATTTPATSASHLLPVQCQVCSGPPEICERVHRMSTCNYPDNYCINHLVNRQTGARTLERNTYMYVEVHCRGRCGDINTCIHDWYEGTSDNDRCTAFDPRFVQTLGFDCTFCCTTDNCNLPVVPAKATLFKYK